MTEPFIGSIVLFAGNFAPRGWMLCQGQLLSISQYTALFSILGTTYGGNGQQTFGLPNLAGRIPMGYGNGPGLTPNNLGDISGTESVTLLSTQMPAHTHPLMVNNAEDGATSTSPEGAVPANTKESRGGTGANIYTATAPNSVAAPTSMGVSGGNQPHSNMQPYLVLNYIIAIEGIFPSRN